ncbi:hypothetical protein ATO50_12335 [Aeromonas hydrophila]|nr:hypothetical protein ATO50_12335 [Aeromonas hydrophila]
MHNLLILCALIVFNNDLSLALDWTGQLLCRPQHQVITPLGSQGFNMRARLALMISSSLPSTSSQNIKSHLALVGATNLGPPAPSVITLAIIIKIMINDDSNNSFNRNQLNSKQESEATATLAEYVFQLVDGWQNEHGKHAFFTV